MADRPTLIRQWQMLRQLSASHRGYSVQDLAAEYEVSVKTIRRDLDALIDGGFQLVSTAGDRGQKRWRLNADTESPCLHFDIGEVAALYLGRRFLEPLAGTALWDAAQSVFVKLRQQFSPEALTYLDSLAGSLHETTFGHSDYSERADTIDTLMLGVKESRMTRLLYHPLRSDTPEEYELQPLGLIWHRLTLYLVASSVDRPEPRHFKVDRIRDVELLAETFTRPADFDLQQHLEHSLGVYRTNTPLTEVRMWFSPDVARYVTEHRWHNSQKIELQLDGSLIVELRLSNFTELKSWVLSFGSQVEVLAPQELRDALTQELRQMLRQHASEGENGDNTENPTVSRIRDANDSRQQEET